MRGLAWGAFLLGLVGCSKSHPPAGRDVADASTIADASTVEDASVVGDAALRTEAVHCIAHVHACRLPEAAQSACRVEESCHSRSSRTCAELWVCERDVSAPEPSGEELCLDVCSKCGGDEVSCTEICERDRSCVLALPFCMALDACAAEKD